MEIPKRKKGLPTFTIPELFQATLAIYRENFRAFIGPVALITVPLIAFNLLIGAWLLDRLQKSGFDINTLNSAARSGSTRFSLPNDLLRDLLIVLVLSLLAGLVATLLRDVALNGLLTYIASESYLGRKATLGEAFAAVRGRLGRLALGLLLVYVMLVGLFIVLAIILFACGLGIGLLVYTWITLYAFLAPVLILERTNVMDGINRARILGKARIWPIIALTAAMTVLSFVVSSLLATLTTSTGSFIIELLLQSLVSILLTPIAPIGYTLLYYDARVRNEALEVAFSSLERPDPRPADVLSPAPVGPFMNSDDFVNLAIIVAGMFVVVLVYVGATFLLGGPVRGL